MDGRRRKASFQKHSNRRVRAHAVVEHLSGMGMGHRRQRAGAGLSQEIRISHGAERSHSPDHAEGGRQRNVPYSGFNGVSATKTGRRAFTRTNESSGRTTEERARNSR